MLVVSHLDAEPVRLEIFISHGVQLGHVDPEIGGLEEILDLFGVGVESRGVDVDVWREHPVDDGALGTGGHPGVPGLAHGLVQMPGSALVNT